MTKADEIRKDNVEKASLYLHMQQQELVKALKEKNATISLLKDALRTAMLVLEEDTVPSPFVEGARNRMIKTIEMIQLAL